MDRNNFNGGKIIGVQRAARIDSEDATVQRVSVEVGSAHALQLIANVIQMFVAIVGLGNCLFQLSGHLVSVYIALSKYECLLKVVHLCCLCSSNSQKSKFISGHKRCQWSD